MWCHVHNPTRHLYDTPGGPTGHVLHQDLKRAPLTPLETLRTASGTPIDHRYQHLEDHRRNIDRIQQEQYNSEGSRTR